jgi:hypothetical protein
MEIKPINTKYNGYNFRSRLEARWAVYFDTMGIAYEYEKEGYDLSELGYYLPDFWLPKQKIWAEVKATKFSGLEEAKIKALCSLTLRDVITLDGVPATKAYQVYTSTQDWYDCIIRTGSVMIDYMSCIDVEADFSEELKLGVDAAMSARFEFGETPIVNGWGY